MTAAHEQADAPPVVASQTIVRLDGLSAAVDAARGRLDDALLDKAAEVVQRGRRRLGLSSEHTIVALAGATGSGKSSLFNALCDLDLAAVGVKRPTTSWALACAWGSDGATEIVGWLGIPERHQVNRTGLLDETAADRDLLGLVLLDLPDHDSTEVSHHLEVQKLVELADVLVWILDPQKYADAAIHDRYLRSLSSHAEVMLVVLNQIDEIPDGGVESCLRDLERLLELDGLGGVHVIATSAVEGDGIAELRATLAAKVSDKGFARERVDADVATMALRLDEQIGSAQPATLGADVHKQLVEACAESAGVPSLVRAVESWALLAARRGTAWPLARRLSGRRADPIGRLPASDAPDDERDGPPASEVGEITLPTAATEALSSGPSVQLPVVQRAGVNAAVRKVVDDITAGMGEPWRRAVRAASTARLDDFARTLDSTVGSVGLSAAEENKGWVVVRVLQWALLAAAIAGGLWWLGILANDAVDGRGALLVHPEIAGVSVALLLFLGGLALGLLTAALGGLAARSWARRTGADADRRLRAAVATQTDEFVVSPLRAEIDAYVRCWEGLQAALRR
ncbi:MAG: 50S ribosome-binding GTPase [Nocardioidaceae bacterium]|nr:50S ribosome-binding GTPase [Nocardioidaceae bacterium]